MIARSGVIRLTLSSDLLEILRSVLFRAILVLQRMEEVDWYTVDRAQVNKLCSAITCSIQVEVLILLEALLDSNLDPEAPVI